MNEQDLTRERWELLRQINQLAEKPLVALAFVWLGLLILDFTGGLSPLLQTVSYAIWALFVLNFVIEIMIAPNKLNYLQRNWLTAVSLVLPALRVLRVFRALRVLRAGRALRSISLIRLVTSLNRGMGAIGTALGRRGFGYVVALTVIVTFAGAAGMYLFERDVTQNDSGLNSYGEAVWWTAMIMTSMGSEYWPQTVEGRVLGWLLAVYALAIFGYITATIASYFVGQEWAGGQTSPAAGTTTAELAALREEVAALRAQMSGVAAPGAAPEPPQHPTIDQERQQRSCL